MTRTNVVKPKFGKRKGENKRSKTNAKKQKLSIEQQFAQLLVKNTQLQQSVFQFFDEGDLEGLQFVSKHWMDCVQRSWKWLYATHFMNVLDKSTLPDDPLLYKRLYKLHKKMYDINWSKTVSNVINDEELMQEYHEHSVTKKLILNESVFAYVHKSEGESSLAKTAKYSICLFSTDNPVFAHISGVDWYMDTVSVVFPGSATEFTHEIEFNVDLVLADNNAMQKYSARSWGYIRNLITCEEIDEHVQDYIVHGGNTNDLYNLLYKSDHVGEVKVPENSEDMEPVEHPTETAENLLMELLTTVSSGFKLSQQNISYY